MDIDWFTFIAQIINFLILMGLLWRFLYRPIMKTMSEREQRIRDRLEEAEEKYREAERKARHYEEKNEELEKQREQILNEAEEEAERERKRLSAEAKKQVQDKKASWRHALEEEKKDFFRELRRRLEEQLVSALSRILKDLADENLESRMAESFVHRLEALEDEERRRWDKMVQKTDRVLEVTTSFELSGGMRDKVSAAVKKQLDPQSQISFSVSEDLICGIEVRADGGKLGWSVKTYLEDLETKLAQAFIEDGQDKQEQPDSEGDEKPEQQAETGKPHDPNE